MTRAGPHSARPGVSGASSNGFSLLIWAEPVCPWPPAHLAMSSVPGLCWHPWSPQSGCHCGWEASCMPAGCCSCEDSTWLPGPESTCGPLPAPSCGCTLSCSHSVLSGLLVPSPAGQCALTAGTQEVTMVGQGRFREQPCKCGSVTHASLDGRDWQQEGLWG